MEKSQRKTLIIMSFCFVLFGGAIGDSRYATLSAGEGDRSYITTDPISAPAKSPLHGVWSISKDAAKKPSHGIIRNNPGLQNHPYQEPERYKHATTLSGSAEQGLKQLRAAVQKYRADKNTFPRSLNDLVQGQYIPEIPSVAIQDFHPASAHVAANGMVDDRGGWYYNPSTGHVGINCTHNANNNL